MEGDGERRRLDEVQLRRYAAAAQFHLDRARYAVAVLRRLEWFATTVDPPTRAGCPICGSTKERGHRAWCELARALTMGEGEEM